MKKNLNENIDSQNYGRDWKCLLPWIYYNSDRNFVRYWDNIIKLESSISEILASIFLENRNKKLYAEDLIDLFLEKGISIKDKFKYSKRNNMVEIIKDSMNNLKKSPLFFIYEHITILNTPELSYTLKL